jgi:hypothetical protein
MVALIDGTFHSSLFGMYHPLGAKPLCHLLQLDCRGLPCFVFFGSPYFEISEYQYDAYQTGFSCLLHLHSVVFAWGGSPFLKLTSSFFCLHSGLSLFLRKDNLFIIGWLCCCFVIGFFCLCSSYGYQNYGGQCSSNVFSS